MAKLSTAERSSLNSDDFAIPEKAPGHGSYPIPDENHARDALSRVSANGTPDEKAKVHAAVKRRYPHIGAKLTPADDSRKGMMMQQEARRILKK